MLAKNDGCVRVMHKKSSERGLLKSFNGKVVDLSFAHCDEILLGCIDETATTKVFKVTFEEDVGANAHIQ
jgi:hypothetical protein